MSTIPKRIGLDKIGIKMIFKFPELQVYLTRMVEILENNNRQYHDAILGSTLGETPNWFMREATADDVTNSQARVVGNLIVLHKTNGTKFEFESS